MRWLGWWLHSSRRRSPWLSARSVIAVLSSNSARVPERQRNCSKLRKPRRIRLLRLTAYPPPTSTLSGSSPGGFHPLRVVGPPGRRGWSWRAEVPGYLAGLPPPAARSYRPSGRSLIRYASSGESRSDRDRRGRGLGFRLAWDAHSVPSTRRDLVDRYRRDLRQWWPFKKNASRLHNAEKNPAGRKLLDRARRGWVLGALFPAPLHVLLDPVRAIGFKDP